MKTRHTHTCRNTHSKKKLYFCRWREIETESWRWRATVVRSKGGGSYNHNISSLCHVVGLRRLPLYITLLFKYIYKHMSVCVRVCMQSSVCDRGRRTNCAAAQRRVNWVGESKQAQARWRCKQDRESERTRTKRANAERGRENAQSAAQQSALKQLMSRDGGECKIKARSDTQTVGR